MKAISKTDKLWAYLMLGKSITRLESIESIGLVSLAQRIADFKKEGIPIETIIEEGNSINGRNYHTRYRVNRKWLLKQWSKGSIVKGVDAEWMVNYLSKQIEIKDTSKLKV